MSEKEIWKVIEGLKWKSDHDYERIQNELSGLDNQREIEEFVNEKANILFKKYESAWLGHDGGPGISVGDDSWGDLVYDVVGRGEDFYNSITVDKLREMANNYDFEESFIYSFN
jgi:hypothetical protein